MPNIHPSEDIYNFTELVKKIKPHVDASSPSVYKDARDIKLNLKLRQTSACTYVIVMAIDAQQANNKIFRIAPGKGTPIGGYVYDTVNAFFSVRCMDYVCLGFIPVAFEASMGSSEGWSVRVPLPEAVIKRYLSQEQLADLAGFKSKYAADCYRIEYLQSVD